MKKRKFLTGRFLLFIALVLGVLVVLMLLLRQCSRENELDDGYSDLPARIERIREMIRLSSLEIDREMVITDTVNQKVICAVVDVHGMIGFDLEKMPAGMRGDTLFVQLPPEKITCYERGYRVIDAYSLKQPLGFDLTMQASEENIFKKQIPLKFENEMYSRGYVEVARSQARESLGKLLNLFSANVVIIDRFPMGVQGAVLPDTLVFEPRERLTIGQPEK